MAACHGVPNGIACLETRVRQLNLQKTARATRFELKPMRNHASCVGVEWLRCWVLFIPQRKYQGHADHTA